MLLPKKSGMKSPVLIAFLFICSPSIGQPDAAVPSNSPDIRRHVLYAGAAIAANGYGDYQKLYIGYKFRQYYDFGLTPFMNLCNYSISGEDGRSRAIGLEPGLSLGLKAKNLTIKLNGSGEFVYLEPKMWGMIPSLTGGLEVGVNHFDLELFAGFANAVKLGLNMGYRF